MKRTILLLGLLIIPLLAGPSFAGDPNYVSDRLTYWLEYADKEGYTVYYTAVDSISADQTFTYELEVDGGDCLVVAEGGEDVINLDMTIKDANGSTIGRALREGASPECSVYLERGTLLDVEFDATSFSGGATEDYFVFIVMTRPQD